MTATEKHYSRVLSGGVVILAALACIYAKVHDATGDAIWRRDHTPRLVSAELVDTKCREDIQDALDIYTGKLESLKRLDSLDLATIMGYRNLSSEERRDSGAISYGKALKRGGPERDSLKTLYRERQEFCRRILEYDDMEFNLVRYIFHGSDAIDREDYIVIGEFDDLEDAVLETMHMRSKDFLFGEEFWEIVDLGGEEE